MRSVVRSFYLLLAGFFLFVLTLPLGARKNGADLFPENNTVVKKGLTACSSDPACHHAIAGSTFNQFGSLQLNGLPTTFEPRKVYDLELRITGTIDTKVYGFQLAAVHSSDTSQAGSFTRVTSGVGQTTRDNVDFLFHSPAPLNSGTVFFKWTAPAQPKGEVTFRVASNSANNNDDRSGDHINAKEFKVPLAVAKDQKLYFAHFGDAQVGAAVQLISQVTLISTSDTAVTNATVEIRDDDGQLLTVEMADGSSFQGTRDIVIPAKGSVVLKTSGKGSPHRQLLQGSVTVSSDLPLEGVILFGGTIGVAGVGSSKSLKKFVAPVEMDAQASVNTGIAVINLETTDQTIQVELLNPNGQIVATGTLSIKPAGHVARFVGDPEFNWTVPPSLTFQGTLRVTATGQIAATVIRQSPAEFATLPVAALQ